jgi:hypothetical protein
MIPSRREPKYPIGKKVLVTQQVRVGGRSWTTRVGGVVEAEGRRPIGGMEMGVKSLVSHQPTIRLLRDDGEITVIAVDEHTVVEVQDES